MVLAEEFSTAAMTLRLRSKPASCHATRTHSCKRTECGERERTSHSRGGSGTDATVADAKTRGREKGRERKREREKEKVNRITNATLRTLIQSLIEILI